MTSERQRQRAAEHGQECPLPYSVTASALMSIEVGMLDQAPSQC